MAKFVTETDEDYSLLDNHTGEILELKRTRKLTMDEFIMVFFSSYPQLLKLSGIQLKVLMCCWKYSSYNAENEEEGNVIHNNLSFKEYCKGEGISTSNANIDNAVSSLCRKELLIKKCRGEYVLNPKYFFKGKLSKRSKIIFNVKVNPEVSSEE